MAYLGTRKQPGGQVEISPRDSLHVSYGLGIALDLAVNVGTAMV